MNDRKLNERKLNDQKLSEQQIFTRLAHVGITGNVLLSAFKLFSGLLGHSGAMISDAVHSLSDVFATIIAAIGVKLAGRDADRAHPYGHERFESAASIFLGLILAGTGLGIGWSSVQKILSQDPAGMGVPGVLPLIAAVVSIAAKELMYHYTMRYAKQLDSEAFKADAWHHRSDAFSSIGSLIGIAAARLGLPIMDPVASIVISLFILKVACDILLSAFRQLLDTACSPEFEKEVRSLILSDPDVEGIDQLTTRQFGNKVYVDVEIAVDRNSTLLFAHAAAERVHDAVEQHFENVKHVMVHVNPGKER